MDADEAVADLVGRSGDRLLRLAFQLSHDRATAEDLVQQALEQVYRRWRVHGVVEQPLAYARRAVLHEFLRRRRLASASEIVSGALFDRAGGTEDDVIAERDSMWRALGRLPERQRAALVLRYYEDLPDEQIAGLLGCRRSTVRSLVARGLAALRDVIEEVDGLRGPLR